MKTKLISLVVTLFFALILLTSFKNSQEKQTFEGLYDGHEDYGYNFIGKHEDGEEYTMTFHKVEASLLQSFDLTSETLLGKKFMVTFITDLNVVKDDDGYEDEVETITIVALKQL